jgi:hypothetical protein
MKRWAVRHAAISTPAIMIMITIMVLVTMIYAAMRTTIAAAANWPGQKRNF